MGPQEPPLVHVIVPSLLIVFKDGDTFILGTPNRDQENP